MINDLGPRGSGRTSAARYLCKQLEMGPYYANTAVIDCSSLKGKDVFFMFDHK